MNERTDAAQEWSLHAHVTITHPGINELNTVPKARTERDENGTLRMVYTWTSDPNCSSFTETRWTPDRQSFVPPPPVSKTEEQTREYRKGNIIFTSVPPRRTTDPQPKFYQKDSGYSSELLSPSSFAGSSLPRRPPQPYNRRCRSTCSIVLSTTFHQEQPDDVSQISTQCSRTHSLRCQTPNARTDSKGSGDSSFYGCGDPWCHHSAYREGSAGRFSPLRETTEEDDVSTCQSSIKKPSRANTYTASSSVRSKFAPTKFGALRDACVQTTEVVDKCTSPLVPLGGFSFKERNFDNSTKKNGRKKIPYNARQRTEPINLRTDSPSTYTPDSLETYESKKKVVLNPAKIRRRTPISRQKKQTSPCDSKSSEASKKPRTVHIDVYCTGTDIESGTSSESGSENKSASTPQTVFESGHVRVTHARASDRDLPHQMIKQLQLENKDASKKVAQNLKGGQEESDNDDDVSTAYPSRLSSYSRLPSLSSFASGFPLSWSTYSTSSCAIPDNDYDSIANTSWKDTFSDIDSLKFSKSSIGQADSTDFVPRNLRYQKSTDSIEEVPEMENSAAVQLSDSFEYIDKLKKKRQQLHKIGMGRLPSTEEELPKTGNFLETSSHASLQASDSFEYANSEDRTRIKTMEEIWKSKTDKTKKIPKLEKKHLIQQQKMKDYFHSRMSDKSLTKGESESDSSSSERGWTFDKDDDKKLERDVTVRRASKENNEKLKKQKEKPDLSLPEVVISNISPNTTSTTTIPCRTPSFIAFEQRLKLDPTLKAPFSLFPGVYTDQRSVAKRYGKVVDAFKKPGHHIGPAKNPHCACDHCKSYFENCSGRGRTLSAGDLTKDILECWKKTRNSSQPRESTYTE